ncbi:MAG: hypothetical protein ACKOOL_10180 [Novosphingobium sp.]
MLAVLLLGGCGRGSEDFTVHIARPTERVMEALGHAQLDSAIASHFPGLKVDRTSPAPGDVLYTIPGDGRFPATVHLTFEGANGGKETVVHAAVDVPGVKVDFDGKTKVISEFKVELALRSIISAMGNKLESGGDLASDQKAFAQLLTALAIVTDSKQLALAKDIERNPDWYMGGFGSLYDGDDSGDRADAAYGNPAVGEDPNEAAREQVYREKERTAAAAAPADDTAGEDTRGSGGEAEE